MIRPVGQTFCLMVLVGMHAGSALAQTSSLGARQRKLDEGKPPQAISRVPEPEQGNPVVEQYSWIAIKPAPPPTFKVNDLVTIIVREQTKFKAKAETSREKQFDVSSQLDAFVKLTDGGLGSSTFHRGKPNVDYAYEHELEGKADAKREDTLTTRITATIIDVKPNGLLVLEARKVIQHDEELSSLSFTGSCRREDVTADNTVLSTQIADTSIVVENKGSLRDANRRGWIPRILDAVRPF